MSLWPAPFETHPNKKSTVKMPPVALVLNEDFKMGIFSSLFWHHKTINNLFFLSISSVRFTFYFAYFDNFVLFGMAMNFSV